MKRNARYLSHIINRIGESIYILVTLLQMSIFGGSNTVSLKIVIDLIFAVDDGQLPSDHETTKGRCPLFTWPYKTSFWCFSFNPPTHLWKCQTLDTQKLSEIQTWQCSGIHWKCEMMLNLMIQSQLSI